MLKSIVGAIAPDSSRECFKAEERKRARGYLKAMTSVILCAQIGDEIDIRYSLLGRRR